MNIQRFYTTSGFLLLAVLFIVFNGLNNVLFSGLRIDLTEQGLYSLSKGTKEIVDSIDEPVQMYFFFSDKATKDLPSFRNYARRVRELLEEYESRAGSRIQLKVIDPEPFSEAEAEAAQLGVQGAQVRAGGEPVYFGLVMVDSLDRHKTIPLFDVSRETALEYEVSELLYNLLHPDKPVVGILSGVDMETGGDPSVPNRPQEWAILNHVRNSFELDIINRDITNIPARLDVLMVVRPSVLTEETLYALDQYVVRGGKALIFDDPYLDTLNENGGTYPESRRFVEILSTWGVGFDPTVLAGDAAFSIPVSAGGVAQRHPSYMNINELGISREDVVTAQLDSIIVGTAGKIDVIEDSELTVTVEPLISTSEEGGAIQLAWHRSQPDAAQLRRLVRRASVAESLPIAVRVSGASKSSFAVAPTTTAAASITHQSDGENINVIFVSDIDILADQFWVRRRNFLGRSFATAISDNGDFVLNALENLTGSSALISIRSRGRFSRPFTLVEKIRREADETYRKRSDELERRLRTTEQELRKLRDEAQESKDQIQIQTERRRAVARFNAQRAKILKQLREVRHQLNRDIDSLDANLRFVNIVVAPVLLVLLMVFLYRVLGRVLLQRRTLS